MPLANNSPATDKYRQMVTDLDDPAIDAFIITPNDSTSSAFTQPTRAIYVGVTGDLCVRFSRTQNVITFKNVPGGTSLAVRADMVYSTNTTATSIVGLY